MGHRLFDRRKEIVFELSYREAPVGIEPTNRGFADLCLTTWLRRRGARNCLHHATFSTHPERAPPWAKPLWEFLWVAFFGDARFKLLLAMPRGRRAPCPGLP